MVVFCMETSVFDLGRCRSSRVCSVPQLPDSKLGVGQISLFWVKVNIPEKTHSIRSWLSAPTSRKWEQGYGFAVTVRTRSNNH